ncbi:chromate efflux transporter [Pelomonas sp. CA6]|uniref:chromate efflux transporter n=1 Tax=Pelomonas sp. CA6 TaxID=2907999 RepID=UPI001F4AC74C|nr:chromate efflux transporter [Pelomonas sp. CA6]MCH7342855.1 chromate efflux transporter [Pelomonas sp. CA6]
MSTAPVPADRPPHPGLAEALRFWLKLGFISFGGPAGQIAILHQELVERRRWISERRFLHALNYCMLLPGPEAQQLATYLGWLLHRTPGGLIAGGLFVLPSLLILIGLSWIYMAWGQTPLIAGLLYGIKPAVAAIVVQAVQRIGARALKGGWLWGIAAASFVAIAGLHLPFPLIIGVAALLGVAGGRWAPRQFGAASGHAPASAAPHAPAVIDDDTPTPAHARFRRARLCVTLALGALAWLLPMAALAALFGLHSLPVQAGRFFSQAALLTFGGAYAVLPYVLQGVVQQHGWISAAQMMDGLALGETTPGPLIMVVSFVGFVAGWQDLALAAALGPVGAGVLAAAVVTWFTFLPSFVFILAGGPLVEATHGRLRLAAPLTAVTAAVVGVILNLALFFGVQVLWPQGLAQAPDWRAAAIALGAAVALLRYRRGVMEVIAACALLGLLSRVVG